MSILDQLTKYYAEAGLTPGSFESFACQHKYACKGAHAEFVTGCEPFVGTLYGKAENGIPRLVFLSLDPGSIDNDPRTRTFEYARIWWEYAKELPAERTHHWRTYELALRLMTQFVPSLTIASVRPYIAVTNSAKCCVNYAGRGQAPSRLFRNCRTYIRRELEILAPDILVTQGKPAKDAISQLFHVEGGNGEQNGAGHRIVRIHNDGLSLWLHSYHPSPRNEQRFLLQKAVAYDAWAAVVGQFVSENRQRIGVR